MRCTCLSDYLLGVCGNFKAWYEKFLDISNVIEDKINFQN